MKKSLLALAVLSAFAGAASAQSSVTLSGSVDLGIVRSNGAWTMDNAASSRTAITLSGTEDLGGGMRVFFAANHRFRLNTGVQRDSNAFWRQGWVGVGGGFGDVRLGKILPPLQDFNGQFEPWGGGDTVASTHTGGIYSGTGAYGSRYINSIYYRSPSLGGLQAHAVIAAADNNSEVSGSGLNATGAERPAGFGVIYGAGPLRLAVAFDRNGDDKKTTGVYGSFNAGFATIMGQYEKGDVYRSLTATKSEVDRWSIGATVPFGAALLKAGYTKWDDEDRDKFGLGLDYMLSKRTILYTNVGKLSGNGYADALGGGSGGTLSANNRKTRFDVGITHRF